MGYSYYDGEKLVPLDAQTFDKAKDEIEIKHYGVKRKSGKHRWGSGKFPYQHEPWFEGFGQGKSMKNVPLSEIMKKMDSGATSVIARRASTKDQFGKAIRDENGKTAYDIKREAKVWDPSKGFPYQTEQWYKGIAKYGEGHGKDRLSNYVKELKKVGVSDEDIAKGFGFSSVAQMKNVVGYKEKEYKAAREKQIIDLINSGMGWREVGKKLDALGEDRPADNTIKNIWNRFNGTGEGKLASDSTTGVLATADALSRAVDKNGNLLDIGTGTLQQMGISKQTYEQALQKLRDEGYQQYDLFVDRLGASKDFAKQTMKVLAPPGVDQKEAYDMLNAGKLDGIKEYSLDGGETYLGIPPVHSVDSSRIAINYESTMDGMIEVRRGVKDLDMGDAMLAQVRIGVDGTHYLKGMAVYADDLPDGIDIRFNTDKKSSVPMIDGDKGVLKPMKIDKVTGEIDKDNPFGSSIKTEDALEHVPRYYLDENGNKQTSALNVVNEPGDWDVWSVNLPPQFLMKEDAGTISKQIQKTMADTDKEFNSIMDVKNPVLRQNLLSSFADDCDASAVHLKMSGFDGQKTHLLLNLESLGDGEVYAPNYENGTKLAMIRYPYAGPYEMSICTVNNNNADGKRLIGPNAVDAIGVKKASLETMSGADCDGDTATCIPIKDGLSFRQMSALEGLSGFEAKHLYKFDPKDPANAGKKVMTNTGLEMGKITNLITDMWNKIDDRIEKDRAAAVKAGKDPNKVTFTDQELEDLCCATKHSMVVVDAKKHTLDYKQSEIDNHIADIKKRYRSGIGAEEEDNTETSGAASLFSRAKKEKRVAGELYGGTFIDENGNKVRKSDDTPEYRMQYKYLTDDNGKPVIDPATGKQARVETGVKVYNPTHKTTMMEDAKDAYELLSGINKDENGRNIGTTKERMYADYANFQKNYARKANLIADGMKFDKVNKEAAAKYKDEVKSLDEKYKKCMLEAPKSRTANYIAYLQYNQKKANLEGLSKEDYKKADKKLQQQCINGARKRIGLNSEDKVMDITPKEYEAMNAGAISASKIKSYLNYADISKLRRIDAGQSATSGISDTDKARIRSFVANHKGEGLTNAEIASALDGISAVMVGRVLNG